MEKIATTKNKLVIKAKMENTLANSIRRYVNHIPVMAIDEVELHKNGSPLYDETVAHRIGLVPLKMEKGMSNNSEVEFKLNVKGPKTVYSGDIKGKMETTYENIPITLLGEGQELVLSGFARMGEGKTHAKFSPGFIGYRNVSEIKMDKSLSTEIKNSYPELRVSEKGDKLIILDDGEKEFSDVCEGLAKRNGLDFEVESKEEVVLTIESFGQIGVNEIFVESIENLKKDLKVLDKSLK